MTLEELVKDVPIERHVGNAPALALVELAERVPGLPEGLILLAVQLGHGRALSAVDDQGQGLLWRKHRAQTINDTANYSLSRGMEAVKAPPGPRLWTEERVGIVLEVLL